jgi:hypothetical protein
MLYKRGNFYWLDIRINGNRIRRSLDTTNKLEALSRYAEKKEELIKEFKEGKVRFEDFCETYLEWAWTSKPASTRREKQRLEKIKEFFRSLDLAHIYPVFKEARNI